MGIHQAMFFIASNALPNTPNAFWIISYSNFGNASSSMTLTTTGEVSQNGVSTNISAIIPNWYTPTTSGIGNSYWVRAQTSSLTPTASTSGTMNTWLALSTARTWQVDSNGLADAEWVITFQFSTTSDGSNIVGQGGGQLIVVDTSA